MSDDARVDAHVGQGRLPDGARHVHVPRHGDAVEEIAELLEGELRHHAQPADAALEEPVGNGRERAFRLPEDMVESGEAERPNHERDGGAPPPMDLDARVERGPQQRLRGLAVEAVEDARSERRVPSAEKRLDLAYARIVARRSLRERA